jgi:hypothetical protein
MPADPETNRNERDPEDKCVKADEPHERKGTSARASKHVDPEQHRGRSAQGEVPLVGDLSTQLDGCNDLEDADHHRPSRNHQQQHTAVISLHDGPPSVGLISSITLSECRIGSA